MTMPLSLRSLAVAAAVVFAAPLSAQTVLTCYKATKIGVDSISDTHAFTVDDGSHDGIKVMLSRATITIYTDSTYSFEYRFKGKRLAVGDSNARTQTVTGRVRTQGRDANGPILALYGTGQTSSTTLLNFGSDGKLRSRDNGLTFVWNTHAGACP